MKWLIIKNDLKRNKIINLALLLFMMFSASLAVLSVVVGIQTFTSISELYNTAQPPHFLQMHKGEINQEEIDDFMSGSAGITDWQTVTMIDIFGDDLTIVGSKATYNLSDCRLDIGLVKQNATKDLLLNSKHQKVVVREGEIGIPVLLKEMYGMDIGDQVILTSNDVNKTFVIKEFILDSQMNSPLASSTRILLSNEDFQSLSGRVGEYEYLIEAYFKNPKIASDFKTAYENAGLPQNGQAVTYTIIFILSAFTDIVIIFVLLLVSLLLISISFICVRFTIMTALEEEIGEIGTMKAIGLPFADIRNLYLQKYRVLAVAGVIAGYVLALLISGTFTKHISTTFGDMGISFLAIALSIMAASLTLLLINFYCKKVLNKIKRFTVVDALVSGIGFEKEKGRVKDGLHKSRKLSVEWLMAIREVFHHFKKWIIVFAVVMIAVVMILVPFNLTNTFGAPDFITYMGSSLEDILIEVETGENLVSGYDKVKKVLSDDETVENYYEYKTVRVQMIDTDQKLKNIDVDCGDNAGNELKYLAGIAPEGENEIALSSLNANDAGKETGDTITIIFNGFEQKLIVSGIYQDVTSGGYTAKSKFDFPGTTVKKYTFSVNLKDKTDVESKADRWSKIVGLGVTVDPMKEFINQTLGGVEKQLKMINVIIVIIAACLVILISVLFLKLRLARDLPEIAVLKAIGFSEHDIRKQYLIKMGCVSATGIVAGIIVTNVLGEKMVNFALSFAGIGINKVNLISNPFIVYLISPLFLMVLILLTSQIVLRAIKKYNIISIINE